MTQDEIIEMVGMAFGRWPIDMNLNDIETFAKLVAAKAIAELESQEQPLPPVEIGVDVTADGASVVALYRRPNAVMEVFYSQFHPSTQRTWVGLTDKEATEVYTEVQEKVNAHLENGGTSMMFPPTLYKAIEAKLKERNNV